MISKIFWLLFPPLNLIVILIFAGWFIGRRFKDAGRFLIAIGVTLFLIGGILPTGRIMLYALEQDYPPLLAMPAKIDGILVLGGAFDSRVSMMRHAPNFYDSGERITEATRLMHLYPDAVLVYSDGNGRLDRSLDPETILFRNYLALQGINDTHVRYENDSRNTYENILYSLPVAHPAKGQIWMLVTSAWHMRRAMRIMKHQDWPGNVIPDPVDYQTGGVPGDFTPSLDMLGNMAAFNLAVREYLALVSYRIGGKIDSIL